MSHLQLDLNRLPSVPIEAEVICPDRLAGLSIEEIAAQTIYHGRRRVRLADFFQISGEPCEVIRMKGKLTKVRRVGQGMSRGRIEVDGDIGMHLGAQMSGGRIDVRGDAGAWVGAEMSGGTIRVEGRGGGQIGAAYRGSLRGMTGGRILIGGSAGIEVGMRMRRGTIIIGGKCGEFAGVQMKGGTLFLLGGAGRRAGAEMRRGTIISLQPLELLPTFRYSCDYNPTFLNLYARQLDEYEISLPYQPAAGTYARHCGDATTGAKGEILIWNGRVSILDTES